MIYYDYHLHSNFSSDSDTSPAGQVEEAIRRGAKGICFTDHMDYDFPCVSESGMSFVFDEDEYWQHINELKERYKDRLEIMTGVELGLRNEPDETGELKELYNKLLAKYPFDFAIGSTHCLEYTDPYYEDYWIGKSAYSGLRTYFTAYLENIRNYDNLDTAGHYDYLVRYVPVSEDWKGPSSYDPKEFMDITDEFLKLIIHRGIALEYNTAGLKYGLGFAHPHDMILKRYLELGGELLTIGSDGHKPEHIFYGFDDTDGHLRSLGFRYYTIYRAHKPEFIKL